MSQLIFSHLYSLSFSPPSKSVYTDSRRYLSRGALISSRMEEKNVIGIEEDSDRQFALKSRALDFSSLSNGYHSSDVEMVAVQPSFTYTSLRDVLPAAAPTVVSPSYSRRQSWEEIPIKNPLVQKGAWAYLQPMTVVPESGRRGTWAALKNRCGVGCVPFLNAVVLAIVRGIFCVKDESKSEDENADDDVKEDF